MKDEGTTSRRPLTESFGEWGNAKIAIFALLGATAGEAVVWYGGQFYALFFLTQTIKVPAVTAQIMIVVALALGTPAFILFGWLSDKIGRKPIILAGFLLAAVTYFPIFKGITHFANPKLETALVSSPVTVITDPSECSFQFKATGTEKFTTGCDIAKSGLVELFPSRIRYSSMSLPYHIGNGWFGGFLPATVFAIVAATGNIYSGLWYPVGVAVMSLVIGFLFLPETKDVDITKT